MGTKGKKNVMHNLSTNFIIVFKIVAGLYYQLPTPLPTPMYTNVINWLPFQETIALNDANTTRLNNELNTNIQQNALKLKTIRGNYEQKLQFEDDKFVNIEKQMLIDNENLMR